MDRRWFSEKGLVKLGQPVPLSNFAPALNSGSPHRRQVYSPSRFSSRKTPQKAASVPCSSSTCRSSSLRSATRIRNSSLLGGVRSNWSVLTSCIPMLLVVSLDAVLGPLRLREQRPIEGAGANVSAALGAIVYSRTSRLSILRRYSWRCRRCDSRRHDQDLATEPNLAMSAARDATSST